MLDTEDIVPNKSGAYFRVGERAGLDKVLPPLYMQLSKPFTKENYGAM